MGWKKPPAKTTNNMFDLERAIAEWRRQMLAAGIKTPVPLEELEIHLREEIEQQMKSGLGEQDAFNSTVQKIGEAGLLRTEFKKAGGLLGWLGENKSARTNRILGAIWVAYCSLGFFWWSPRFSRGDMALISILMVDLLLMV